MGRILLDLAGRSGRRRQWSRDQWREEARGSATSGKQRKGALRMGVFTCLGQRGAQSSRRGTTWRAFHEHVLTVAPTDKSGTHREHRSWGSKKDGSPTSYFWWEPKYRHPKYRPSSPPTYSRLIISRLSDNDYHPIVRKYCRFRVMTIGTLYFASCHYIVTILATTAAQGGLQDQYSERPLCWQFVDQRASRFEPWVSKNMRVSSLHLSTGKIWIM